MPSQKNFEKTQNRSTMSKTRPSKRYRTSYKVHLFQVYLVTCIIASLVLCVQGDDRFRPDRPPPRPGPSRPPPPGYQRPPYMSDDDVHIADLPVVESGTLDAAVNVSIIDKPSIDVGIEPQGTTTAGTEKIDYEAEYPVDDCPDCDEDDDIRDETVISDIKDDGQYYQNDSGQGISEIHRSPAEELNQMIEGLDKLLSNESAVVTMNDVSDAFDQMDSLLGTNDTSFEFPCTVLTALDTLGARADLNGSNSVATARRNVAVVMAESAPERPVRGLRIAAGAAADGFTDEGLEVLEDELDSTTLTTEDTEAVVNLPASLADSSRRISFVVFRSDRAFTRRDHNEYVVNSKIISVNVENFTQMADGEVVEIHLKPSIYEPARNMSRACAYWHFDNDTGYWSQEGCIFIKSLTGLLDTCRCTHLTHFAEILVPKLVFSEEHESALEVISLVGCFLSLFGLIVIALTSIIFKSWRRDFNNKIWIQLTIALLINVISFLVIVFSKFEDYNAFCMAIGIILHYASLASFCWMLVAAVISYRKLVLVFATDPTRRLLKASAFSWLAPLAIVVILVSVAPESYTKRFEDHTPTGAFCYPSGLGLWLTVFVPIALVVVSNWVLFALILRSVFGAKSIQKHGDSSEMLRRASVSCLLVFLFGLPWVFGLFAYNIVAAYLFTLTTSYQGFVLFIFFIIINSKTRGMWLNKLRITKKTKPQVNSSLATSKNAQLSNEPEQVPFLEPSSSRTNVTSLVSSSSDGKAVAYNTTGDSATIQDSHYNSRDSDIDSFITAKSHENFSEDEIFKSTEGITDKVEDDEENHTKLYKSKKTPNSVNSRDSTHSNNVVTTGNDNNMHADENDTSKKDDLSDNSSQKVEDDGHFISPDIKIYNVSTQNASLISSCN